MTEEANTQSEQKAEVTPEVAEKATPEIKAEVKAPDNGLDLLKAQVEELQREKSTMKAHMDKMLGETKAAKAKKEEAVQTNLKEAGKWKEVYENADKERLNAIDKLALFKKTIEGKEIYNTAIKAAATIADGPNIEHIADSMVKRMEMLDGVVRFTQRPGGELEHSDPVRFAQSYKDDTRFASLVRGTKANGGSATGNTARSATLGKKQMTWAEFTSLPAKAKMEVSKSGVEII